MPPLDGGSGGGSRGRRAAAGADTAEAESPMSMSFTNQYMGAAGSDLSALTTAARSAARDAVKRPGEVRFTSERRSDQPLAAAAGQPPRLALRRPLNTDRGGLPLPPFFR